MAEMSADRIPADVIVERRTITKTFYEACAPTNSGLAMENENENSIVVPTQSVQMPNTTPTQPPVEVTSHVHMTSTSTKIVTVYQGTTTLTLKSTQDSRTSVQENSNVALTKNLTPTHLSTKITTSIPGLGETGVSVAVDVTEPSRTNPAENQPIAAFTSDVTPTHLSTKITTSISGYGSATVSIAADVDAPSKAASVEDRPVPAPTHAENAPGVLQKLPGLPQLLPATVIPNLPLPTLDQVLHPENPSIPKDLDWTSTPKDGHFSTKGFGGRSMPKGTKIKYKGNVGLPWGSNIISVSPTEAHRYKYVAKFTGSNDQPWTVVIWNKIGPDNKMDGWYGHSALRFVLAPGETRYVAFDEDSEGAWSASPGTKGITVDHWGGYTSTWGEFSFGDQENDGWSGWDVSAIQSQLAHGPVQGMRICMADGKGCSVLTPNAEKVISAYTADKRHHDGIGGAASPGPVRLVVDLDYKG